MANPSDAAKQAIREYVTPVEWAESTDAELRDRLNAPSIPNPSPQSSVLAPISVTGLMQLLTPEEAGKVLNTAWVTDFRDAVVSGDRERALNWVNAAAFVALVSPESRNAVAGAIMQEVLDPDWPAQVSWAEVNLGRQVDIDDIAAARAAGGS